MSWLRAAATRLHALFSRQRLEHDLNEELRFHLEMQTEDNRKAGMAPAEARYAALRSFGAIEPMKESYRERRSFAVVETAMREIRYALRTLGKSPGFTFTSVTLLALALGANTAMFSVLQALLFRPLPYRAPEQLAMLWREDPSQVLREGRSSFFSVDQWRKQNRSFADMAFFDPASVTLSSETQAEHISVVRISPNFFALLGVRPLLGNMFTEEQAAQRERVALISHSFWRTRFGGSPGAIGATLVLNGMPSRITGVLPATFRLATTNGDVWEPHSLSPDWEPMPAVRGPGPWFVLARLRPEVTPEQAQAEMNAIAQRLDEQLPAAQRNQGISVVPLRRQLIGQRAQFALWMLAGAIFCVLLIAATNVASLSLARSASREREMAVRRALGASQGRIVGQLLAESLTLAGVSGLVGIALAEAGIRLILSLKPGNLARLDEVALDPQVVGWSFALCLFTGIVVGLAPAFTMARGNVQPSGHGGGRSIAGGAATRRIRRALVVTQFALAIVLLAGAGLLLRSLRAVQNTGLGFEPRNVLSMQLSTAPFTPVAGRAEFHQRVLEQVASLPGVKSAGIIGDLFIGGNPEQMVTAEGVGRLTSEALRLRSDEVSAGFFQAMGTPLLRGRFFTEQDGSAAAPVAIVNAALAQRLWPGLDAVGRRFRPGADGGANPWFTVVGVVGDMRRQGLETEPIAQMFEPLRQNPPRLATLLVRTADDDPLSMVSAVQAAVRRVEKHAPMYGVTSLEQRLGDFLSERRFQTLLVMAFAVIAVLMAAIGIYGLIQYSIAARTHEIGIRMAIGAQAGEVFRMVLREGLELSLMGLAIGLVGALWMGRAGESLLFGVSGADPLTFLTVSLLLTAVSAAACYFPARRAMRIEPVVALRTD